jgi:hypothetical protein
VQAKAKDEKLQKATRKEEALYQPPVCFVYSFSSLCVVLKTHHSDLKPLLDVVDPLIISTAESGRPFSSTNDVFTATRNSLLLKTVSHLVFIKTTDLLFNIIAQKDSFGVRLRKEDAMLMSQQVDRALLEGEKSRTSGVEALSLNHQQFQLRKEIFDTEHYLMNFHVDTG